MSGPKLMHITNDPKVIQRINNRLNTIGKENYFSSQIQSINIDIQNEMIWIKNYVNETMNNTSIQQDKVEYLHNSLIKIQNNYLIKLSNYGNDGITRQNILILIVDKINDIPTWFYLDNPYVKNIMITLPDKYVRKLYLDCYYDYFIDDEENEKDIQQFIDMTEGRDFVFCWSDRYRKNRVG